MKNKSQVCLPWTAKQSRHLVWSTSGAEMLPARQRNSFCILETWKLLPSDSEAAGSDLDVGRQLCFQARVRQQCMQCRLQVKEFTLLGRCEGSQPLALTGQHYHGGCPTNRRCPEPNLHLRTHEVITSFNQSTPTLISSPALHQFGARC